jgi:TATA-box binding protein (TBP) (component of TFIID and TFIIIB)
MIHSMNECLVKLKAINNMAIQGVVNSKGIEEKIQFESIAFEINYLINEAKKEKDK